MLVTCEVILSTLNFGSIKKQALALSLSQVCRVQLSGSGSVLRDYSQDADWFEELDWSRRSLPRIALPGAGSLPPTLLGLRRATCVFSRSGNWLPSEWAMVQREIRPDAFHDLVTFGPSATFCSVETCR